jgi:hypothetical protein
MTEREEAQQRHDQRKQRSLERRAPTLSHDDQILTFRQWCTLNAISERTGARILRGQNGPVVTQLSTKRIGIRVRHNRQWQDARARNPQPPEDRP